MIINEDISMHSPTLRMRELLYIKKKGVIHLKGLYFALCGIIMKNEYCVCA